MDGDVYVVFQDQFDCDGELTGVEVVLYATQQTAKQHVDAHGGTWTRMSVLTKLRAY